MVFMIVVIVLDIPHANFYRFHQCHWHRTCWLLSVVAMDIAHASFYWFVVVVVLRMVLYSIFLFFCYGWRHRIGRGWKRHSEMRWLGGVASMASMAWLGKALWDEKVEKRCIKDYGTQSWRYYIARGWVRHSEMRWLGSVASMVMALGDEMARKRCINSYGTLRWNG